MTYYKKINTKSLPAQYSQGNKYFFWSIFVTMPEEARRGPGKLRFILSNQKELRTRAEKWKGMFSSFKHGVPSTAKSAGDKITSSHALAVSARSLAVGNSEIYALLLNNG